MSSRAPLMLATATIVVLWRLPYGQMILYPFTLLATYAHEMGHGLTALLVGGEFDQIALYADGSGTAHWHGNSGKLALALVAAGGLLGPTVTGVIILILSRSLRHARVLLAVIAGLVSISLVLWARNPFAIGFLLTISILLALSARWLPDLAALFLVQFTAILLCLAWYRDLDYMFSAQAIVDGVTHPSDSALIAQALMLPYWFWGGVIAMVSLTLLALGLRATTHCD
jgi:hypothetical protein